MTIDRDDTPVDPPGRSTLQVPAPWLAMARIELERPDPNVGAYLAAVGSHDHLMLPSAFANYCLERSGYPGTGRPDADSWLTWGQELTVPALGCVVVVGNTVAFYLHEVPDLKCANVLGCMCELGPSVFALGRTTAVRFRWPRRRHGAP